MIWLLGGYMWLYVHRPFELTNSVGHLLGSLQFERMYMILLMVAWAIYPYKGFSFNRIHVALALFTLALTGAWVMSPYSGSKGSLDVMETYFKIVVFYVIVVTTVRDEKTFRLLILLFLVANAVYMAHSLREWVGGRYQVRMGVVRMIGIDITWGDPNAFASTLLFTLPLLVPFWFEAPRRVPRWAILGYALACCYCILRTASRAGFIGLLAFLVMLWVGNSRQKLTAVLLCALLGGVAGAVAVAVGPEDLVTRYTTLFDENAGPKNAHESAEGRLIGFTEGLRVWGESPLFGHGPNSFAAATGRPGQAHNLFGQVLSELGLAGGLGLLALVVCFFLNLAEARALVNAEGAGPPNDFAFQTARALCYCIVLMLLMGWSGHNLFRYNWQWFAAFSAIAVSCIRQRVAARQYEAAYGVPMPQFA